MRSQPPDQVPVLSTLALQFGVCTRWFCSVEEAEAAGCRETRR